MSNSKEYETVGSGAKLQKLKLNLDEINEEMNFTNMENEVYLDTQTGEIIYVPVHLNEDNIYDEEYIANLPEWERDMVEKVKEVYANAWVRFIAVPERGSREAYGIMVKFAKNVEDIEIAERLFDALDGRGAFSRFKRELRRYPDIEDEWYKFKAEMEKREVREWLRGLGIEPVEQE